MAAQVDQQTAGSSAACNEDLANFGATAIDAEDVEQDVLARVMMQRIILHRTCAHADRHLLS
jgi:hypothetical protein